MVGSNPLEKLDPVALRHIVIGYDAIDIPLGEDLESIHRAGRGPNRQLRIVPL
ncbi:hypothetical protein JCM18750_33640 [Halostagnicola bangensis]